MGHSCLQTSQHLKHNMLAQATSYHLQASLGHFTRAKTDWGRGGLQLEDGLTYKVWPEMTTPVMCVMGTFLVRSLISGLWTFSSAEHTTEALGRHQRVTFLSPAIRDCKASSHEGLQVKKGKSSLSVIVMHHRNNGKSQTKVT